MEKSSTSWCVSSSCSAWYRSRPIRTNDSFPRMLRYSHASNSFIGSRDVQSHLGSVHGRNGNCSTLWNACHDYPRESCSDPYRQGWRIDPCSHSADKEARISHRHTLLKPICISMKKISLKNHCGILDGKIVCQSFPFPSPLP